MISDFVKGKKQYDYPQGVQAGMRLHRMIDAFTDSHASTREIKEFFRPHYRLYAGAFADIVYDYFLANDKNEFPQQGDLMQFSLASFDMMEANKDWLGERFGAMFPKMKEQNWLYNYQYNWGICKSFEGLRRRSTYIVETETAFEIFEKNKSVFEESYHRFFPQVKTMAKDFLQTIKE